MTDMELDDLDDLCDLLDELDAPAQPIADPTADKSKQRPTTDSHPMEASEEEEKKSTMDESIVCSATSLRVNPATRRISRSNLELRLRKFDVLSLPVVLQEGMNLKKDGFVTFGVVVNKYIKTTSKGSKFITFRLSDLKKTSVAVFIFDTELVNKLYKLNEGTFLVIGNPNIMEPRKDNESTISLNITMDEQILIIGESIDMGRCKAMKKDGNPCTRVVNVSRTQYCEWHVAQIQKKLKSDYVKFASRRNDTNRGMLRKRTRARGGGGGRMGNNKRRMMANGMVMPGAGMEQRQAKNKPSQPKLIPKSALQRRSLGTRRIRQMLEDDTRKRRKERELEHGIIGAPQLGRGWSETVNSENKQKAASRLGKISKPDQHDLSISLPDPSSSQNRKNKNRKRTRSQMQMNIRLEDPSSEPPSKKRRVNSLVAALGNNNMDSNKENEIRDCHSSHDDMRVMEEKDQLFGQVNLLGELEKCEEQMGQVTCLDVLVHKCTSRDCPLYGKSMDRPNAFCRGHVVEKSKGKKYFWKCRNCGYKMSTINKRKCVDSCRRCGKRVYEQASAYTLESDRHCKPITSRTMNPLQLTQRNSELRGLVG